VLAGRGPLERRWLEQPLTVYLDGPTGYAFIYLAAEGWKFVGRIHDPGD
jgi:hypothetical protein